MHRQVGQLTVDDQGLAKRGLLIRHLVMPGALDETRSIFEWIATELGTDTYVNVIDQYHPAGKVDPSRHSEISRPTSTDESHRAVRLARVAGLERLDYRKPPARLMRRLNVV